MGKTLTYKGHEYSVIPELDDAVEEFFARKAKGEKGLAIIDMSFHSQDGFIIVVSEESTPQ